MLLGALTALTAPLAGGTPESASVLLIGAGTHGVRWARHVRPRALGVDWPDPRVASGRSDVAEVVELRTLAFFARWPRSASHYAKAGIETDRARWRGLVERHDRVLTVFQLGRGTGAGVALALTEIAVRVGTPCLNVGVRAPEDFGPAERRWATLTARDAALLAPFRQVSEARVEEVLREGLA